MLLRFMKTATLCIGLMSISAGSAASTRQQILFDPHVASDTQNFQIAIKDKDNFEPLKHLAGISPYFTDAVRREPPEGCSVVSAVYLLRHSSIASNDDEWKETMAPFVEKLERAQQTSQRPRRGKHRASGDLNFLNSWKSPITAKDQEKLTKSGAADAKKLGQRLATLYPHLLPNNSAIFNLWTADASRDVDTAQALLDGLLPDHKGDDGNGDGHVKLIKVPLKSKAWASSLTPHKICQEFTKKRGRQQRQAFEERYTQPIIRRFDELWPDYNFTSADIVAMQQFCGYETVVSGHSPMCNIFTKEEFLDFEYANDLHYYYMEGFGSEIGPRLGFPFLKSAARQLWHPTSETATTDLPKPKHPPSKPLEQDLFIYLTHREEPPAILTTLGIYNDTQPLPYTHRVDDRKWQTSRIIPFLGHVALERLHCAASLRHDDRHDFIRVLVNEQASELPACHHGIDGSCPLADFEKLLKDLGEKYGDFESACGKIKL